MGKPRTPADKAAQKERTLKNKRKKYERALHDFPNHKDAPLWKMRLEKLR